MVISGSPVSVTNSLPKARIGETVIGCNIGIVVTGNPVHDVGNGGTGTAGKNTVVEFQGRAIIYTEVDFGNNDDDPDTDDGLNIYPPIPTSGGVPSRAPTAREIERSNELDASPTTTVDEDPDPAPPETTPPTTCTEVVEPVPDNFQLSPNFTLSDLSIGTALSKNRVRARSDLGLTVQDIVCNLQAWAENIGEGIAAQYGRGEILVTSGFRLGRGSQHDRGQAVDFQFPNMDNQGVYNVSVWIRDNLPFDQLILEYGGYNPWIHCSFNRAGNRSAGASNKFGTRTSPGNYTWGKLIYMT
jgi:hypothetical protein